MKFLPPLLIVCVAWALVVPPAAAQDEKPVYQNPAAPSDARAEDLLSRLTTDERIKMLGGTGFTTQPVERLGLPAFQMADASCGVHYEQPSPAYTASVCLAASWDAELARRVGTSLGRDCRARGVHFLLAPGVNLYRAPMDGRNFEYLGEDPVLTGQMAGAFIRGIQSQGVAATLKHFAANNQEWSRHDLSSDVDERTLRELYLRTFQIALREGQPKCVMNAYNPVNGIHASQNRWLLNDILREEFHFPGFVMSDWVSCYDTLGMANAGLDLEMPKAKFYTADKLQPLLADGRVTVDTIADKVRRQLRVAFEMGWFDRPQRDPSIPHDDPASYAVNVDEARGGITLLKNTNNLLPLDPATIHHLVVVGPNSDHPVTGGGGSAFIMYSHAVSVLDALRRTAPSGTVDRLVWVAGMDSPADGEAGRQTVREADAVVVCVGFDDPSVPGAEHGASREGEGSDRRYALPPGQAKLITSLAKLNPRVIVVLNAGGSVETASWIDHAPALLHAFYPGSEGNTALAEIIFGKTNPSGKLPFSWEKRWEDSAAYGNYPDKDHPTSNTYKEGVLLGYRWFDAKNIEPLFPFGFGLSYTQFELSKTVDIDTDEMSSKWTFHISVRNTGSRAGADVVQIYVTPPIGALPQPPRELRAFDKVFLQPGESKEIKLTVSRADLSHWDPTEKKWMPPHGNCIFRVGDSSRNLPVQVAFPLL